MKNNKSANSSKDNLVYFNSTGSIHMITFWITLFGMSFFLVYCFFA